MAKSNRSGFTALEMSVVVTMILILVGLILPSLVSRHQSELDRTFKVGLSRLAAQAREGAIMDNRIYHLQMDGEQTIVLRKEDENGSVSDGTSSASLTFPDGTSGSDFTQSGKTSNAGDWDIKFYPDGTSDSGGLLVTRDSDHYALNIDKKGHASLTDELVDQSSAQWDAGGYESRTSS